jgi:hypothetical protein
VVASTPERRGRDDDRDDAGPPDSELELYRRFWGAVLEQAVADSCTLSVDRTTSVNREQARAFLRSRSVSLLWLLDTVGLDRSYWRERCLPELERRWAMVDARLRPPPPRLQKAGQGSRRRGARARSAVGGYPDTPEAARAS